MNQQVRSFFALYYSTIILGAESRLPQLHCLSMRVEAVCVEIEKPSEEAAQRSLPLFPSPSTLTFTVTMVVWNASVCVPPREVV
jgi:hypothetical protein